MKKISTLSFIILTMFGLLMIKCTHEDVEPPIEGVPPVERGDDIVSFNDGYFFAKEHSSIRWQSAYLGTAALITGRFNEFEFELEFDEANPENIELMGKVTLSSVNTGEPGRDQGCLLGTFGVDESDEAVFVSRNVAFDEANPTGYIVTGDLTFHGVTDEVIMTLNYTGTDLVDLRGTLTNVAGFEAQFEFNALTVYGLESSNIADRVVVNMNGQFKQPQ